MNHVYLQRIAIVYTLLNDAGHPIDMLIDLPCGLTSWPVVTSVTQFCRSEMFVSKMIFVNKRL